jgi:hypothetical protein
MEEVLPLANELDPQKGEISSWFAAGHPGGRAERRGNPRPPYPPKVRGRAVRMLFDHQDDYSWRWKAIESIAAKLSINHETLRICVRPAETDAVSFASHMGDPHWI